MSLREGMKVSRVGRLCRRIGLCDPQTRPMVSLAVVSLLNSGYALYHGILGLLEHSIWFMTMGAFYGLLTVARSIVILCSRRKDAARKAMRWVGLLLVLLSCVMAGINQLSLSQHRAARYDTIPMITLAAYIFGKLIFAVGQSIRQRRDRSPLYCTIRRIRYAEVGASMLTLQQSMLVSFGGMAPADTLRMNAATGAGVFLLMLSLGLSMLLRPD